MNNDNEPLPDESGHITSSTSDADQNTTNETKKTSQSWSWSSSSSPTSTSINKNNDGERPTPPLEKANLFSRWFFQWTFPLLQTGMSHPLVESDLPGLCNVDTSSYNKCIIEDIWKEQQQQSNRKENRRPRLHVGILKHFLKRTWFAQWMLALSMAARLGQAMALGFLLEQFADDDDDGGSGADGGKDSTRGYVWTGALVICGAVFLFSKQRQFFVTCRTGMQLRIGLVSTIYSKSTRLSSIGQISSSSSTVTNNGQTINLASNDVERFVSASIHAIYVIYGPIEAIAIYVLGLYVIGPAAISAGFALLLLFVPLQFYIGKRFAVLRSKVAAITDDRVSLVSQAVSGVRVMKMSGWETNFDERIAKIRSIEMGKILSASRYKAWIEAIHFSANVIVCIVTFSVHVIAGGTLSSRNVFTTMSLINILQATVAKHVSHAVMCLSEAYVSSSRIQRFLELPEISGGGGTASCSDVDRVPGDTTIRPSKGTNLISLRDVTCYWNGTPPTKSINIPPIIALCNINIDFKSGQLYCLIGTVGSGKSALLQTIAGELPPSIGRRIHQTPSKSSSLVSYAAQDAWIMNGSIRDNITFGNPYKPDLYRTVLASCGLDTDVELFPDGDRTIVGDRGVQCSGGQRARIGLARALYRDSDVVLLDDPLSAVDSKVGRLIYDSAILDLCVTRLGKCVILATHQHQFLRGKDGGADVTPTCILMDGGRIMCQGSYLDCVDASNGKLISSLHTEKDGSSSSEHDQNMFVTCIEKDTVSELLSDTVIEDESTKKKKKKKTSSSNTIISDDDQKETRTTGIVRLNTWKNYAIAMGGIWVGIALLLMFMVTQTSALVCIIYIGKWAEKPAQDQGAPAWLGLIFGLGSLLALLAVIRARLSLRCCIKASQRLHDTMTRSVLRAKIEFFDTNPIGRILNRFSADVGICDDLLPLTIFDFLVGAFLALGSVVTAIAVLPFVLLALPPLLWYFLRFRRIFVTTTRELKRLEGTARSPIFAMIGEALTGAGIATMRANQAVHHFSRKFEQTHDAHTRAFFAFVSCSRWFAFRMDMIAFVLMSVSSLLAVLFHERGWFNVSPAVLGLTLTMLLQLAGTNFPWVVRQSAEVVNQMVSVERLSGFGQLPSEAALVADHDHDSTTNEGWPRDASIAVTNLTVRYRASLPPALSGVTFNIESGQRVGIVGRTGSGKSSLVQALFRILEAESGTIKVGGIDISKLGLHRVRTSMSVIPQSPVLFSGCSVRENLDPFNIHDDASVKNALSDVQMMDVVNDMPHGLNSILAEGGSNLSVGQRQLLCLARAILRKTNILVLDEPTANVDARTESCLQEAVAKRFTGATQISVAHRLETIIDHDLVLVFGEGKLLECGSPSSLLSIGGGGHFAFMVENTGERMAKSLRKRARMNVDS